ncbi:MAG: hypothetical protein AAF399_13025 [Bacteroidota bacterium]
MKSFSDQVSRTLFATLLLALFALTACQTEEPIEIAEEDQEMAIVEAETEATYEEVDAITFEAIDLTDATQYARSWDNVENRMITPCVTVTHDSANKVITLDFGTGCVGPDGKLRAGQIIITYTYRIYLPGASLSVALQNYSVDGIQVEGTRTLTNVSPNFQSSISLNTTLVGGQITYLNGDVATRDFSRTTTWVRAANPINDEMQIEGMAQGTRRNGISYQTTILSPLVIKRKCRWQGVHMPVEGVKKIQRSNRPDLEVDFGTGDCDRIITLTMNNQSIQIDLDD